eukprot:TRINITY_DN6701_c0_g4_i1.p1 TRINITY_DN6701_c0_g4~~TRINITY_DN6701_c0_g4_i1.p1  ORF type:complete len:377 (+),score=127.41 TRINITY_DN6701_c0_g4_i1:802-1932(+)
MTSNPSESQEKGVKYSWPVHLAPLAVDIGGSFSKVVYWRPESPPDLPNYIIKEFQKHQFESAFPLKPDPSLAVDVNEVSLKFLKFPSNRTPDFIDFIKESGLQQRWGAKKTDTVNATGGGSYKYKDVTKSKLGVDFVQQDEMKCLVRGLNFCLTQVNQEAFTYNWKESKREFVSMNEPNYPFPYLLVNIGSGVSILRVDNENSFERVSGSSLGGGTFWALAKELTDIKSYDEVQELSQKGDNKNVDLLVGDIYGSDYSALGLKADLIASSLGKIAVRREDAPPTQFQKEDVVKSLLFMISNNIGQIGYLNAKLCNVNRIFFSGGFLQENSFVLSRLSYAVDFWSKGEMKATFLQHNSYLGCLGALLSEPAKEEETK